MTGISGTVQILAVFPAQTADFTTEDSAGASRRSQMRRRRFLKNDGCRDVVGANLSHLEALGQRAIGAGLHGRLAAIDADEMRELVEGAWAMCGPRYVAAEYAAAQRSSPVPDRL